MTAEIRVSSAIARDLSRGGLCRLPLGYRGVDGATAVTIVSLAGSLSSVLVAREKWREFAAGLVKATWSRHTDDPRTEVTVTVKSADGTELTVHVSSAHDVQAIEVVQRAIESSSGE